VRDFRQRPDVGLVVREVDQVKARWNRSPLKLQVRLPGLLVLVTLIGACALRTGFILGRGSSHVTDVQLTPGLPFVLVGHAFCCGDSSMPRAGMEA
jgi:hypothetical protein